MAGIRKSAGNQPLVNQHFIFIEAPIEFVGPEAVWWGEGKWWPADSNLKFVPTSKGELAVGATFDMQLVRPVKQTWKVEVTKFEPGRLVERTFKKGLLKGFEVIRAEERANGTRVDYELHYAFENKINELLWMFCFRRTHDTGINKVLASLQKYCLKQMEQDTDIQ